MNSRIAGRWRPAGTSEGNRQMINRQTLSKPGDFTRPDARLAAPRVSHIGDRSYPKYPVVRTSNGVRLAVCDTGPRTAEHTVVFLHGLCLNEPRWDLKIPSLMRRSGRSVRVISYDHRGHGRSAAASMNTY